MSPLFRLLMLLVALCLPTLLVAQRDDETLWREMLELWVDQNDSEQVPDDLVEQLQLYVEEPINLNDTASQALNDLPFLTEFQRQVLRAYIAQNGQLASLAELHLLNGFDTLTLRLLRPFVTVAPVEAPQPLTLRQVLRGGHSNLRVGTKSLWPRSRAYSEDIYEGSPWRLYFRYRFSFADRVVFQLSGDKDPGESMLRQQPLPGFDYYGYYLMVNNIGVVKRAVVGKYQLQFGQGATLWSGFAPWMSGSMPLWRYGQGIKASSAFCEFGFLHGAAATVLLAPAFELTAFYSNVNRDATLAAVDTASGDAGQLFQGLYSSGYHRTANEIGKKGVLGEQLFGGRLQYRASWLTLGATAYRSLYRDAVAPADYVYNAFAFRGRENLNVGLDFICRYRRLLLFGEVAMACNDSVRQLRHDFGWLPVASVVGMQLHLDANNNLSLAYRYGSPTYQNLYSNTIGQSSTTQNESGMMLFFQSLLPYGFTLQTTVDLFRYSWMRYRLYSPSSGVDCRVDLARDIAPHTTLSGQYRYRSGKRNSDLQLYSVEDVVRRQLRLSVDYNPGGQWRSLSRLVWSWFDCEDHGSRRGFLIFQELSWRDDRRRRPFSVSTRLALFDIEAFDARIYAYESDLMYEFSVPMLTGRGLRTYLVFRHELTPRLSYALKYAFTCYPEQESVGSGYDRTDGNCRHELKAQLRLKF